MGTLDVDHAAGARFMPTRHPQFICFITFCYWMASSPHHLLGRLHSEFPTPRLPYRSPIHDLTTTSAYHYRSHKIVAPPLHRFRGQYWSGWYGTAIRIVLYWVCYFRLL
ncbi:hypothetical protein EDB92DRAFT_4208 [Lactarius akahatsu]|uniref:Uncharacterized protein n=1 Tax=Lactarius akahatsu TaxID=416441 RepID=A0AAD4LSK1_9AGAM|nr:hypothetical protein EDB92DRAFT_4208 [Lactarius akahatsu]